MADCIAEAGLSIPILGVNFGSLGFLTEVTLPELYPSLEAAVTGQAHIEERLMLRSKTMRRAAPFATHLALNDVVITKTARSRLIDLSVSVGDEFLTTCQGRRTHHLQRRPGRRRTSWPPVARSSSRTSMPWSLLPIAPTR
mgnify:CR=1 FL=1